MTRDQSFIASALFVGFFVIWFLWAELKWPSLNVLLKNNNAAAWVQAFGSISAILITAFIARYDSRKRVEKDKDVHAKEMRRIFYFLNKTGLSESLYFLLTRYENSKLTKFGETDIRYTNIYFIICVTEVIRRAFEVVKDLESSASIELLTSKCGDEFFVIFNTVQSLNGFCNLKDLNLNFDRSVFVVKSYINFISLNKADELNSVNEDLKVAVDFMKQQFHDLDKAYESIKVNMNY